MNSIISINSKKVQNELSYLDSLEPKINRLRTKFYIYANTLQYPINEILINHFNERLKKANGTPMLGEYTVYVLGDIFSISEEIIEENSFPWFILYEYSLLLDDLLDKNRSNWQLELLTSQLLLDKSFKEYIKVIKNNKYIVETFDLYRNQSINSMIYELNWSKKDMIKETNKALNIQGRKSALMKFCVSCLVMKEKDRMLNEIEEKSLDNLCAGIQLLDDLTDVLEDHKEGRMNILLQETYIWLNNNLFNQDTDSRQNDITVDQLITGLIYSGSINNTLEVASELINKTVELDHNKGRMEALNFLKNISSECINSSKELDELLLKNSKYKQILISQNSTGNHSSRFTIENNGVNKFWQQILEYFKIMPKACN